MGEGQVWPTTVTDQPELEKRTWVYMQRPAQYSMPGCECGNQDTDWSEFKKHLWCAVCQKDFIPSHAGIFDGPIMINMAECMGICFDRFNLDTQQIEKFSNESEIL